MNNKWTLGCLGLLVGLPALGMVQDKPPGGRPADLPALIDTLVDLVPGPMEALNEKLGLKGSAGTSGALRYPLESGQVFSMALHTTATGPATVDKVTLTPVGNACFDGATLIQTLSAKGQSEWHRYPFPWTYKTVMRGKTVDVQQSPRSSCIKALVIDKRPPLPKLVPGEAQREHPAHPAGTRGVPPIR